jgi:hypothetical protein
MAMKQQLGSVLGSARVEVALAWAQRVSQSSERYRRLPFEEVQATCQALLDGLVEALVLGSFESVSEVLKQVARRRTEGGFERAEVERALLLGCDAVYPALQAAYADDARALVFSVTQVEKTLHRCLGILSQAVHDIRVAAKETDRESAEAARRAAEARLQAVLRSLGHGAVAVSPAGVVVWADERARSARCGLRAPGDVLGSDEGTDRGEDVVAEALETGEMRSGTPGGDCDIWLAIPVRDEAGQVVEVVAVMGPPWKPEP